MKKAFVILMVLAANSVMAQSVAKIENHPAESMDLVLFTFGMEHSVPVGTVSKSGELSFSFPENLNRVSEEAKSNFMSQVAYTLFSKCDNSSHILSEDQNGKAVPAGYISLSTKVNPYAGLLFMVTDELMVPWIESYGEVDAVLGSYFELIYIESEFNFQGECTSSVSYSENNYQAQYVYDLQLKPGFNFIEYKIESVEEQNVPSMYEENTFDKIQKPSKIVVSSSQSTPPNTKWIGKYF